MGRLRLLPTEACLLQQSIVALERLIDDPVLLLNVLDHLLQCPAILPVEPLEHLLLLLGTQIACGSPVVRVQSLVVPFRKG